MASANASMDKELKKQLLVEKAREKLQKYKLSCTKLEAKKGLEPLKTCDGKPVQIAILFHQWEKQLVNWMKTVNIHWAVSASTTAEKKKKHAKAYACLSLCVLCIIKKITTASST